MEVQYPWEIEGSLPFFVTAMPIWFVSLEEISILIESKSFKSFNTKLNLFFARLYNFKSFSVILSDIGIPGLISFVSLENLFFFEIFLIPIESVERVFALIAKKYTPWTVCPVVELRLIGINFRLNLFKFFDLLFRTWDL